MKHFHAPKYRNVKTDGYDSKREAKRAAELKLLQQAGQIDGLREQVTYELIPAHYEDGKCIERACKYIGDFEYYVIKDGEIQALVVEDCKGFRTPEYVIKRKLMLQVHGIRVREV